MFFSVLLYSFVTTQIPFCGAHSSPETRYECGPHGKFEYCIDGIPGCVIGCHCHPGYYFDTDSKICEPNIKLTQDIRRHYFDEPTRAHRPPAYTPTATDSIPTPTTIDDFDDKVDEITKDTDDLGDWLYNQFFKTIENQVINNNSNSTKNDNDVQVNPPTRRSSGGIEPLINKSRRKTRKSMRVGKKKKHMKVHGLRRKLLRITEDDSLFDSESDSDSSDSSSGSDSDSSSDTSGTSDASDGKKSPENKEHGDHGHKKVIIFNRRPKPPLPSFIFLPSMDTPYYPPIGLPAPPAMPMYPMVPVPPMAPPMAPPMFPFPGPAKCDGEENTTTTTTTTSSASIVDTTPPTNEDTPGENTEATEATPDETESPVGDRRSRLEKHRNRRPDLKKFVPRANEPGKLTKLKHGQRNKLMEKLRNKMKEKKKSKIPPVNDHPINEFKDGESLVMDEVPNSSELYIPVEKLHHKNTGLQIPKLEDVDFKYLSELIHRVNQSDGSRLGSLNFDLSEDIKALQKLKSEQTRRNFNPYNVEPGNIHLENYQHRNLQKQSPDDAYYTNLGRQIASMIRNSDTKLEHQMNKEQANRPLPFHSVLNENNYAPRSFWERSIRSPLSKVGVFTNYLDESRTLKHNNEKKLFNLENEVEIFASTSRSLSLQDLENILNTVQKAHDHIKYREPIKSTEASNVNLNINLLPRYIRPDTNRRFLNTPNDVNYVTEHPYQRPSPPKVYAELQPTTTINVTNTSIFHEPNRNADLSFSDYWMYNYNPRQVIVNQTKKSIVHDNQIYNPNPTQQPTIVAIVRSANNRPKKKEYLQFLKSMPVVKHTTAKRPEPKLLSNPPLVNYKSLNYFTGHKHHYMFEEATYPLHITPFKRHIRKPFGRAMNPSYFHHALHHFDYFD